MSDKVILTCTECLSRNYTTTKNKKTHNERIELMKFCNAVNIHFTRKRNKEAAYEMVQY